MIKLIGFCLAIFLPPTFFASRFSVVKTTFCYHLPTLVLSNIVIDMCRVQEHEQLAHKIYISVNYRPAVNLVSREQANIGCQQTRSGQQTRWAGSGPILFAITNMPSAANIHIVLKSARFLS